jgi:DNA-binding SARP family transcriptional activator/DNA-binding PadR family transcriptional regulator
MTAEPWMTPQTLQVLKVLLERPAVKQYGLQIAKQTGLAAGSLYPILSRLEQIGWLGSEWEDSDPHRDGRPRRRYYHLTGVGLKRARQAVLDAGGGAIGPNSSLSGSWPHITFTDAEHGVTLGQMISRQGDLEVRILGPLEVVATGSLRPLGGFRQRATLALLLLHAGHVVSSDRLVKELWNDRPTKAAFRTLQSYVSHLRGALEPERPRGAAPEVLLTRASGYLLQIMPDQLDANRFERLFKEGSAALEAGNPGLAAAKLGESLSLWRGPALAEFADMAFAQGEIARLGGLYLVAVETRVEADLALGRHAELVGELEALIKEHPLRERLRAQLMLALYRSGQQAKALRVYRDTRALLVDELGIEPDAVLQRLEKAILLHKPELDWPPPEPGEHFMTIGRVPSAESVPASQRVQQFEAEQADPFQLPPGLVDFTGREAEVEHVRGLLERDVDQQPAAVVISTITGKAGVGKTALAIHVAHQVRQRFLDGQLYVNLRGISAQPLQPTDVLAEFLRSLGVPPTAIPDRLEDRAGLYRARLSSRQVLVVLDNAADEAQVRPLLPGSADCAVLVTSRRRLAGLEGATTVDLDVMDPDQAIELLTKITGPARVDAEAEAAAELARLCGYLPLAVRIAGARLAAKSHWRLAGYAARLQDEHQRLEELRAGDLEVRASFMLSYQALSQDEQQAFRLLGLLDAPDFAAWVVAALLDCALPTAENLVERLVDAQLIEAAPEDPTGRHRYRFHDLLRVFARERLRAEEPETVQQAALERVLATYLGLAQQARARFGRDDHRIGPDTQEHSRPVDDPGLVAAIERDPLAWFKAEQENLIAGVGQAHEAGLWELTWELTGSLSVFLESRAQWNTWEHANELALDATRKATNRRAEAYTLRSIATIYRFYRYQGRGEESLAYFERCLALFAELRDQRGTAYVLLGRGATYRSNGGYDDALVDFDRCLPLFAELEDEFGEAATLREIGVISHSRGRFDDATACLTQALTVFQRCGARLPAALTLGHLGLIHRDCGRFDEAVAATEESLTVLRELGNRLGEARALRSLGEMYRRLGRVNDALDSLDHCLSMFREMGDRSGEAWTLRSLGDLYRDQGRLDEALACFDRCLPVFRELGARTGEADALHSLGKLFHALGRDDDAMGCFDQSLVVFRQLGLPLKEARVLTSIGILLAARGDQAAAQEAWRQAWPIFRDLGVPEADQIQAAQQ